MSRGDKQGSLGAWKAKYSLPILNAAGEQIPPYAVIQLGAGSTVGTNLIYNGVKPTGSQSAKYVLNSPALVSTGGYAAATEFAADALVSGSPAFNQEIGPTNNSWALSSSGKGFIFLGGLNNGVGRVAPKPGGDDFPIVQIVNNTGLVLPYGSIVKMLAVGDPAPAYKNRIKLFNYVNPTQGEPFAVTLADIAIGGIGDAAPVGVVDTQLYYNDTSHNFADATTNNSQWLTSGSTGQSRIIWRERGLVVGSGTLGLQWARVQLNWRTSGESTTDDIRGIVYGAPISAATGTVNGPITPGTGLVKLFDPPTAFPGNPSPPIGSPWVIQTQPTSVENWMFAAIAVNKPVLLRKGRTLDNGTQIYCVIAEGCQPVTAS